MPILTCPKCAYARKPTDTHVHEGVCPACGIAYQKYLDRQAGRPEPLPVVEMEVVPERMAMLRARLLQGPAKVDATTFYGRAACWCAFALWAVWFTVHGVNWAVTNNSFLHNVILPFHEFGHVLFMPLGRFMTILGGSLFQVAMPLGLAAAFIIVQRDTFGASAALWWGGQSMVDLAPYISDAVDRAMPLVGGAGEESHDWGNLLRMTDMLGHAQGLARLCFGMGVLVMVAALAWGYVLLRAQYRQMNETA
jgi:hypothetical protein